MPDRMIAAVACDLKPIHWPDAALDAPLVLFNPFVQVFALADFDRLQRTSEEIDVWTNAPAEEALHPLTRCTEWRPVFQKFGQFALYRSFFVQTV